MLYLQKKTQYFYSLKAFYSYQFLVQGFKWLQSEKTKKQRINQIPSVALSFLLLLNLWFGPWWVAPIIVTLLAQENMLNPLWPRCYMTHMTWVRQEPAQPRLPVWPALLWSSLKNQSSRLSLRFSRSRTRVRCFSHRIKTAEHPPNFLSSTHFFLFF